MFDSKAKYSISVISLSVSLLVGCAASKPEAPAEAPKAEAQVEVAPEPKPEPRVEVVAEPKAEAQAEVAYVEPSVPKNKERPDWIYNEEASEENNQVTVVGVSKYLLVGKQQMKSVHIWVPQSKTGLMKFSYLLVWKVRS